MSDGNFDRSVVYSLLWFVLLYFYLSPSIHRPSLPSSLPSSDVAEKRAFVDLEAPPPVDSEVRCGM